MVRRCALLALLLCLVPATAAAQALLLGCERTQHFQLTIGEDGRRLLTGAPGFPVVIECGTTTVSADSIGEQAGGTTVLAIGNVLIEQPGLRISAARAEMNLLTQLGTFEDAHGFLRVGEGSTAGPLGADKADMEFYAERLEKTGARTYKMTNGRFTACAQPTPRWQFTMSGGTITLDKHALMRNAVLKVKNVPVFYVPLFYYPLDSQDRSTGFLMPSYGNSTIRGTSLSNAFFWAISRSMDATFFHDWFTKAGQGFGSEYRYVTAPGSEGHMRLYMLDEAEQLNPDGTIFRAASRSFDLRGGVNQALPSNFRLVGRLNYFSDVQTKTIYQQDPYEFSQRTRELNATISGAVGRARITALIDQRDWFFTEDTTQRASRNGSLPKVGINVADQPIGPSAVYFGASGETAYLVRQDDLDDPTTNRSLWRFDGAPRIRAPLSTLSFLTASASASWRVTHWLESRDPETDLQVATPITRQLFELRTEVVGPVLSRVFDTPDNGYAERFKHLIEPFATFQWFSPFDQRDRVVQIDGTDTLVGGSAQLTYGVTNRLLARRRTGENTSAVRDILTVGLRQTYYTDLTAAAFDAQYSSATDSESSFSPIDVRADFRPTDGLSATFQTQIDAKFRTPRSYSLSGAVTRQLVQFRGGWSKRRIIPGLSGFEDPASATHYLTASTSLRTRDSRVGGSYDLNYDFLNGFFANQRITAFYNAQCCGITFDYQTISFANFSGFPQPADRRFGISFSLAGLASFSNPLGSFGR